MVKKKLKECRDDSCKSGMTLLQKQDGMTLAKVKGQDWMTLAKVRHVQVSHAPH